MEYASATFSAPDVLVDAPRPRRRHYRQRVQNLAYVRFDQANGGIIRDLSESGIAVQAVAALQVNQEVLVRFELLNPRTRVEVRGRVAWSERSGQAGMEFLAISERIRHLLKEWIFTQLMATAEHAERANSVFLRQGSAEAAADLFFSEGARPPIQVRPEEIGAKALKEADGMSVPVTLLGSPVGLTARGLGRIVDSLLLLCAVLLFSIISLGMTNLFPAWPLAIALALGITSAFAAVYWYLFAVCVGMTPGEQLARIACKPQNAEDEPPTRFR
jgi:PilZ domain